MGTKKSKGILLGALVGTLAGTLGAFLLPQQKHLTKKFRNQAQDILNKAKIVSDNVLDLKNWTEPKSSIAKSSFAKGAILGLIAGLSSALLLSPKTGKQMRKDLTQTYQDIADKTTEIVESFHLNGYNTRAKHHHRKAKHPRKKKARSSRVLTRAR